MKRIVVVGMSENPGGIETYLVNFLMAMKAKYNISFVNMHPSKDLAYQKIILSQGGSVFMAKGGYSLKSYINRTRTAKKILKRLNADIVYVNALTVNDAYWVMAAKKLGIPAVYHSHNTAEVFNGKLKGTVSKIIKPYNQRILKYATHLAASDRSGLFMFGDLESTVVHNSINPQKWEYNLESRNKVRRELKIKDDQRVIIMVSRLSEQKNVIRAVKILKKVVDYDPSYTCLVVGDGELRESVASEVEHFQIKGSVRLLGKRNDVPDLMSGSDVFILPSLFEGLPFVAIEAQGSGLPIVASKGIIPSIANITNNLQEVSLTSSDDVWARKIVGINVNDKQTRIRMNRMVTESSFAVCSYNESIRNIFENL